MKFIKGRTVPIVQKERIGERETRRPRSGAQSGSCIYQFGWVGGLMEFDAEFKFAKIQNSHVEGGGGGGGLAEFDAEFKFAKIQNSHVEGGWVGARGI